MDEEVTKLRMDLIKELGLMAYKFLITLNSGAFIVLLTFIGSLSESPRFTIDLENLRLAMYSFLVAIMFTFVSMAIAYISAQLSLLGKSLPMGVSSTGHIVWLMVPIVLAFGTFILGVVLAIQGLS